MNITASMEILEGFQVWVGKSLSHFDIILVSLSYISDLTSHRGGFFRPRKPMFPGVRTSRILIWKSDLLWRGVNISKNWLNRTNILGILLPFKVLRIFGWIKKSYRGVNHFNITTFLIFQRDFWLRHTKFLISRDFQGVNYPSIRTWCIRMEWTSV